MMKKNKKEKKNLFFKKLLQSIKDDQIPLLSAQTTYHFIMSLVPFLIVLLNIVLMVAASKIDLIFKSMEVLPEETRNILMTLVNTIISNRSSSVLSISLLVALWSSSKALKSLITAMNKAFDVRSENGFLKTQLKSILFTVVLLLLLMVTLVFIAFGGLILNLIEQYMKIRIPYFAQIFRYLIPIVSMIFGFTLLYKFAPDFDSTRSIKWKSAMLGGTIATIGWLLITLLYSFYVSNISNMSLTYGPLVGVFALFVWINLSSQIILISAEITANYDQVKKGVIYST